MKKLEGPVYSIERRHHFNEIDDKMEQLKQMNYPIREGVDPYHLYGQLEAQVIEMKTLTGPVYQVERAHRFSQVEKKISELKTLFGPCYDVLHQNRFQAIESHVENLKNLQGSAATNIPIVLICIHILAYYLLIIWGGREGYKYLLQHCCRVPCTILRAITISLRS